MFWSISDQYPDLLCSLHVQIRLIGNYCLNLGIPWIADTDDALCFVCKRDSETLSHFLFDCPDFWEYFDSLWSSLNLKVTTGMENIYKRFQLAFLRVLIDIMRLYYFVGCLPSSFDSVTATVTIRCIVSAIGTFIS